MEIIVANLSIVPLICQRQSVVVAITENSKSLLCYNPLIVAYRAENSKQLNNTKHY